MITEEVRREQQKIIKEVSRAARAFIKEYQNGSINIYKMAVYLETKNKAYEELAKYPEVIDIPKDGIVNDLIVTADNIASKACFMQ